MSKYYVEQKVQGESSEVATKNRSLCMYLDVAVVYIQPTETLHKR
jgi:hypothetical protein